jgi:predicted nucleic acid-binding protein
LNVVSDSSPIIALSSVGRLNLLRRLLGTVQIPTAVKKEVMVERRKDVREGMAQGWIVVREVADSQDMRRLRAVLGAGEAEAISLALESTDSLLLVDDRLARSKAIARGVRVVGTLGVVAVAAERGLVGDAESLCRQLVDEGFWVSESVIRGIVSRWKAR